MALCFEEGSKCYNFLTCKKTEEIIDQGRHHNLSIFHLYIGFFQALNCFIFEIL